MKGDGLVLTTVLDVAGVVCVIVFLGLMWLPLAVLGLGASLLLASWSIERGGRRRR